MSGDHTYEIAFRTDRVSSRQLWGQAWGILWPEYFWITLGICLVGLIVSSAAPMAVLMGPMMCGMYLCFFAMMRNQRPTFEMLFKGFDTFIESLVATLIMVGVSFLVMIPLGILVFVSMLAVTAAAQQGGGEAAPLVFIFVIVVYLAAILAMMVVQLLFVFAYPLIADYNLSGWEAVKLSARAAWANLGNVVRLMILNMLVSMLAMVLCYLPILLVIPVSMFSSALLYRRIFPEPEFATAHGDFQPDSDPGTGGYQLDGNISETGPGAGSEFDEFV